MRMKAIKGGLRGEGMGGRKIRWEEGREDRW
jgi:hypothetical protein